MTTCNTHFAMYNYLAEMAHSERKQNFWQKTKTT
jgi:hypothetical protein